MDIDNEAGQIVLDLETRSSAPDALFQIYCFQNTPGATLETARAGMSGVFTLE